ncbi:MAG: hypothetical protein AAF846_12580 [Chloroflexota bacterium]
MSYDLKYTVNRQIGYSVNEISTPKSRFDYLTEDIDRKTLLKIAENKGYTYFPIQENGVIVSIMPVKDIKQNKLESIPLTSDWLIAAEPILHLLELFAKDNTRNFFVLSSSEIVGLVSPADLNRIPARASVYLLVANFETLLTELIRREVGETLEKLRRFLSENSINKAIKTRQQEQNEDLELPIIHYLQWFDLVDVIAEHETLRSKLDLSGKTKTKNELKFNTVRNTVAHLNNLLIKSKSDIEKINDDCSRMIRYTEQFIQILNNLNHS